MMYRTTVVALFISLAIFCGRAQAQGLESRAGSIRALMDGRDFTAAEGAVKELRAAFPEAFAANNYDYLLARLLERRGARAEAAVLYQAVLGRKSVLSEYALWHLGAIARASGDLTLERQHITRLMSSYPSSALLRSARDRLVESFTESGDYRAVISLVRPAASVAGVRGRSAMARLGQAYSKTGDAASARGVFNQLINNSRDDYALAAAEGLDALDGAAGVRPAEFEALRRARIYLTNRHWEGARAHFLDVVERFPEAAARAEAIYQVGFTYYRQDNYEEAIKWFERAHREFPAKKDGEQGYYWVGTALQKARRYPEAARRYGDFITAYPDSELVEAAYRNVVDSLRFAGDFDEAARWSGRITQEFAGEPLAVVGVFNEAKIELTRGRLQEALQLFTRLQSQPIYPKLVSAPIRGEAAFLRVYTLEQMGRLAEAARAYLAIPDGRDNYFGQRATARLRAMASTGEGRRIIEPLARGMVEQARAAHSAGRYNEAKDAATQALRLVEDERGRRELLSILRASYSQLPAYASVARYQLVPAARDLIVTGARSGVASHRQLAAELIFLGLYDEGAIELRLGGLGGARASQDSNGGERPDEGAPTTVQTVTLPATGDVSYSMAVYSNRGNQSHYAIRFGEPASKTVPQDYRLELLPRDLAELIYPAPYRDAFNRYAPALGVDPRLVLSLARQESRFDPSVKSGAAARGLLQFITETALKTAQEEGLTSFELDDVYEPEVAVRLAVRYVASLFKLFPNNPIAVVASYNTGEQNVERWIFRSRSNDVDRLVAEIAIPETKDYVGKVMSNYRAYRLLYTEDLRPNR